MKDSDIQIQFLDYCVKCQVRINNLTANNLFKLHSSNPNAAKLGEDCDIYNQL